MKPTLELSTFIAELCSFILLTLRVMECSSQNVKVAFVHPWGSQCGLQWGKYQTVIWKYNKNWMNYYDSFSYKHHLGIFKSRLSHQYIRLCNSFNKYLLGALLHDRHYYRCDITVNKYVTNLSPWGFHCRGR